MITRSGMLMVDVFRVIHAPFHEEPNPWLVVNLGTGRVVERYDDGSFADQVVREKNRLLIASWARAGRAAKAKRTAAS